MGSYDFQVLDICVDRFAAVPQLTARLRLEETTGARVHAAVLRSQVRIEPQRRGYSPDEARRLLGLFGPRDRWSQTLRPLTWMHCATTVQGFTGSTEIDLPMVCSYDFDVTGSLFLHALEEGSVPLELLFTGTVFTHGDVGFAAEQVPWDRSARYDLPVAVWAELIVTHFPGQGWVRLDHDVMQQLAGYRARHGLISWEETVTSLLAAEEQHTAPREPIR